MSESNSGVIPAGHRRVVVTPAGAEGLAFSVVVPNDWEQPAVPQEEHDFANPTAFMPLGMFMVPYGPMLLVVVARPAYDSGTVSDWLAYLLKEQDIAVRQMGPERVGGLRGVACDATQQGEGIVMRVRAMLIEDGGRMINVTVMAPEPLWESAAAVLRPIAESFTLLHPQGQTVPLVEGETGGEADEGQSSEPQAAPSESGGESYADLALADDAGSLDPEHPVNANIRDGGNGLVPNVVGVNEAGKFATVAAAAVMATFNVPLGWHVIDDGRRTLVFDAGGKVQVNLNLVGDGATDLEAMIDGLIGETVQHSPSAEHVRFDHGGVKAVAFRNLSYDEPLEQAFLLREHPSAGLVLKVRVTADPPEMRRAVELAGALLQDMRFAQG